LNYEVARDDSGCNVAFSSNRNVEISIESVREGIWKIVKGNASNHREAQFLMPGRRD
jgi:hypothetical protein